MKLSGGEEKKSACQHYAEFPIHIRVPKNWAIPTAPECLAIGHSGTKCMPALSIPQKLGGTGEWDFCYAGIAMHLFVATQHLVYLVFLTV